jgi:hypothetical protein
LVNINNFSWQRLTVASKFESRRKLYMGLPIQIPIKKPWMLWPFSGLCRFTLNPVSQETRPYFSPKRRERAIGTELQSRTFRAIPLDFGPLKGLSGNRGSWPVAIVRLVQHPDAFGERLDDVVAYASKGHVLPSASPAEKSEKRASCPVPFCKHHCIRALSGFRALFVIFPTSPVSERFKRIIGMITITEKVTVGPGRILLLYLEKRIFMVPYSNAKSNNYMTTK